ncbi:MAG: NAD(P)H-binding protein, partial [Sphingomonadales bacterium]|nr:NAD(P)H-binding protein [Sphingomonadales bacterium]
WIPGELGDRASLAALVEGCDAVIHVAGAISAPDRAGFASVNIDGTRAVIEAVEAAGIDRLIHISSLAAREPEVSDYGWSKAGSEEAVRASRLDWTIIRPPAVYGATDRQTLELFRMANRGLVILPPRGRLSIIHVADLSRLLLACLDAPESVGQTYEPDDGSHNGLSHRQFAQALGRAVGKRVFTVSVPSPLVRVGARLDRLFRGDKAKLTPDRARYFCHPDWVSRDAMKPPGSVWKPAVAGEEGLSRTAHKYREKGWL